METTLASSDIDARLALRLKTLRSERGWTLDELAQRTSISRATLSRIENLDVSPTAGTLGVLAAAYGLTMSRLLLMVEEHFSAVVPHTAQQVWTDAASGFARRAISPPAQALAGEAIEVELKPGASIHYASPPRPGLEHHLYMLSGALSVTVKGERHDLKAGDCLRYQLYGENRFETPDEQGARYVLFLV